MKAIGYVRCSTEEQAATGHGLEAQRKAIRSYAESKGLELGAIHEDAGVSGSTEVSDRPGLLAVIADLQKGDVLIVAKRDRLGRDPLLVGLTERLIERKGCRTVSAAGEGTEGSDPSFVLMRRMVDAFAEYERLMIGARTKAALQAARGKGIRLGRPRFGERSTAVHERSLDESQMEIVREIDRMFTAGGMAQREIARELNRRGAKTIKGREWTHKQVANILKFYGGTTVPGKVTA